jgi:putative transposase
MTKKFQGKYCAQSTRLREYDYGQNGAYFVTVCTKNKQFYFGNVVDTGVQLSNVGIAAEKCWREIPKHFPFVQLDKFVVMPNHIHGIVFIQKVETQDLASLQSGNAFGPQSRNLASVIRGFKIGVTKYAKNNNVSFAWQSRFWDRVIRNETELNKIREYIDINPQEWHNDKNVIENNIINIVET